MICGLTSGLSWRMSYLPLRRMCILSLLGEAFCICLLDPVHFFFSFCVLFCFTIMRLYYTHTQVQGVCVTCMSRKEGVESYLGKLMRIALDQRENFFSEVCSKLTGWWGWGNLDWGVCGDHPNDGLRSSGAVGTDVCSTHPLAEIVTGQCMKGNPVLDWTWEKHEWLKMSSTRHLLCNTSKSSHTFQFSCGCGEQLMWALTGTVTECFPAWLCNDFLLPALGLFLRLAGCRTLAGLHSVVMNVQQGIWEE